MAWFSQRSVWFKLMATSLAIALVTGTVGFVGDRSLDSAKSYAAPSKPARRKSAPAKSASRRGEELELVGVGAGGFEEF